MVELTIKYLTQKLQEEKEKNKLLKKSIGEVIDNAISFNVYDPEVQNFLIKNVYILEQSLRENTKGD